MKEPSRIAIAQQKAQAWLEDPRLDKDMIQPIKALLEDKDPRELLEAFSEDIRFGTGGLRALMGPGSARINAYTVRRVSEGLAAYLHQRYPNTSLRAVVGYDSRLQSDTFANITAQTLSLQGIHTYLFDALRPTPLLSFAIRHLTCQCGVVITASHNPKAYNGYKVFGEDGAQLTHPQDQQVIEKVQEAMTEDYVTTQKKANIESIGEEIDMCYTQTLVKHLRRLGLGTAQRRQERLKRTLGKDSNKDLEDLGIVYSSLHGTGITLIPQLLKAWGYTQVHVVETQASPDGNFPTVACPNPEEPQALHMAIEKATQTKADLVLATDPDADRVGIAIRTPEGAFELLNGHQVAALLTDYVLSHVRSGKDLFLHPFMVKTIVTTTLVSKIAAAYEVPCYDTPTGFKYIAALIRENEGQAQFVLGVEESCGYLLGDFVRDKDALGACLGIAEMALCARTEGKTLLDKLEALYRHYGWHEEHLLSITKAGITGMQDIASTMQRLRHTTPQRLGGMPITTVIDYAKAPKHTGSATLAPVDMLQFHAGENTRLIIRPSGTEPKIKCYLSVHEGFESTQSIKQQQAHMQRKVQRLKKEILSML